MEIAMLTEYPEESVSAFYTETPERVIPVIVDWSSGVELGEVKGEFPDFAWVLTDHVGNQVYLVDDNLDPIPYRGRRQDIYGDWRFVYVDDNGTWKA